jgi:hypothetical protein
MRTCTCYLCLFAHARTSLLCADEIVAQIVASLSDSLGTARLQWQVTDAMTAADEFGGERGFTAEDEEGTPVEESKADSDADA